MYTIQMVQLNHSNSTCLSPSIYPSMYMIYIYIYIIYIDINISIHVQVTTSMCVFIWCNLTDSLKPLLGGPFRWPAELSHRSPAFEVGHPNPALASWRDCHRENVLVGIASSKQIDTQSTVQQFSVLAGLLVGFGEKWPFWIFLGMAMCQPWVPANHMIDTKKSGNDQSPQSPFDFDHGIGLMGKSGGNSAKLPGCCIFVSSRVFQVFQHPSIRHHQQDPSPRSMAGNLGSLSTKNCSE